MDVPREAGRYPVREYVPSPEPRDFAVQPLDVGHPPAEHDDVRIEQVDHRSQGAREALLVALQTFTLERNSFLRSQALPRQLFVVAHQPRTREVGLDAAETAAIARRQRQVRSGWQRQRVMAPFTRDRVRPG